ncbi:ester cyclase [Primorskyibacter sp. S187A]|uniref:nuclear transport factor 2 family protein n=1 Tax=Primorskyibacter sp. S187A TaxID=3415130 RepID=UPI003C79C82B
MPDFQTEKDLVRAAHRAIDSAGAEACSAALAIHLSPQCHWRGYAPFYEQIGPEAIAESFWGPFKRAFSAQTRREDVFFAGKNEIDGFAGTWVVSMGHLMGLFDAPWLGIQPTGKMAFLRYAEFCKVADGQITEVAFYIDIPHLMMQAGLQPFPPQTAAHLVQPGPATHDGLLFDPQDAAEGEATLALINSMISDLGSWNLGLPLEEELRRTWAEDMIWWGPAGIGATYTIERYAKQHSGPFRAAFGDRSSTGHVARLAEGHYGGFFGWPNFTATHKGGFMGLPAGTPERPAEFRVIDIYRREGDKLAENWIFIDMIHFLRTQGVDILARMAEVPRT